MSRFGVNLMFSCVAKIDHDLFYPRARIPSLIATYPVLTGYVPSYLEKVNYPASIDRPIDIGYRSRPVPYYLGALGQEKQVIAARFQEIADRFDFTANISIREEDRIYGADWLSFMKASRSLPGNRERRERRRFRRPNSQEVSGVLATASPDLV